MRINSTKSTDQDRKGSFLWQVKGGNAKMFLNGTVHIVPENFFPLKDELTARFEECRNLVVEVIIDKSEFNYIKVTDDILNNKDYIYEDGDSLYNHFPKEKVISLRNYLLKNKLCSPVLAKKFYKLKPAVVKYLILNAIYKKVGINLDRIGIDDYFMMRANEMGKNLIELETREFQQKLLNDFLGKSKSDNPPSAAPSEKNESEKLSILDDGLLGRFIKMKILPRIAGNFVIRAGKAYGNEDKVKKSRQKFISKGSALVGGRDVEMAKKLIELLKTKDSYFVAVGAAHLIGEGSIVHILQKSGYEVTRIF
jgi:uncharacterized protein